MLSYTSCSQSAQASSFFFSMLRPQPRSTLFPYTTLFRSNRHSVKVWRASNHEDRKSPPHRHEDNCGSSGPAETDRKSTRLNSSHITISYAVFCLKKKKKSKLTIISGPQTRATDSSHSSAQ